MSPAHSIAELGGFICVSSVALILARWCSVNVSRLCGGCFVLGYLMTIALVFQLKLVSAEAGSPLESVGLLELSEGAPSGHAALSFYVYGLAAVLFTRSVDPIQGRNRAFATVLVIAAIAVALVAMRYHTVADVVVGAVIGGGLMLIPGAILWRQTTGVRAPTGGLAAAMALAAIVVTASGLQLSSADII